MSLYSGIRRGMLVCAVVSTVLMTGCAGNKPKETQVKSPVPAKPSQDVAVKKALPLKSKKKPAQKSAAWHKYHRDYRKKQELAQRRAMYNRRYQAKAFDVARFNQAALSRTKVPVTYDGRYLPISYPMGDVPKNMGVCTDTVVRSYRHLGIDLQRLVHEDMSRAFHAYPNLRKWGLSAPDPNIDHRRVHNLKVFFTRHGQRLPVTNNPEDYRPGDLVTWHLGGDQEHIGIVVNKRSKEDPRRFMIVHNIAHGNKLEDVLFKMPITGHYRYFPNREHTQYAAR